MKTLSRIVAAAGAVGFLVSGAQVASAWTTTASTDATAMANALVGSPGVVVNSASYTGAVGAAGSFSGASPNPLPFATGIVLTTGQVSTLPLTNTISTGGSDASGGNGTAGDAALSALSGATTFDASILTINFTPEHDIVSFQFVFASEEYKEYVGSEYNDVFAFYLNGVNIALLPDSTPITINNVNQTTNSQFYADNPVGGPFQTRLDGLVGTKPGFNLFAQGSVNAGVQNTIRLAIADSSDSIYDSAVFLAGGSFKDEAAPPQTVPLPAAAWAGLTLLGGLGLNKVVRRRRPA